MFIHLFRFIFLITLVIYTFLSIYRADYQVFAPSEDIKIEVRGALENEGIFSCKRGETIADLIGQLKLKEDADLQTISLTQKLYDRYLLVIPHQQSLIRVSLNSATAEELASLHGVSHILAERIVRYREQNGPFQSIEQLLNVKGIGVKKFEKIIPFIRL